MGFSAFLLVALWSMVVFQLQFNLSTAQTFVQLVDFNNCNNSTYDATIDYKPKSSYDVNLQLLLSYISNNTGNGSRHYARAVGRAPDTVYGVFQCRGDLATQDCKKCAETAVQDIAVRCPNNKEMSVWYDECFLRYSIKHGVSSLVDTPSNCFSYANSVTDPNTFRSKLYELMNGLVVQAAKNATSKFDIGATAVTNSLNIYGLVQCSQYLSSRDCTRCLNKSITRIANCSDGKDGGRILQPSCVLWYEVYNFFESDPLPTLRPPSNSTDFTKGKGQGSFSKHVFIIVFTTVAVVSILTVLIIGYLRKRRWYDAANKGTYAEGLSTIESLRFTLERLIAATDNFSESNKLGEGGFGVVYRGRMNERDIAVKRLTNNSGQGVEEFKNEVLLLAKLEHKNLVRLLGFCLEGNEKLLIYEFIENSSLDQFIFDPIKSMILDWERRYNIVQGIARGLLYLHEDSPHRIIHRDLKASNVLLDAKMNPKISDFGQARLLGVDQTQGKTFHIVGTQSYMPPEYLLHGQFSAKSDVFSFGVLVLEIIAGQRNSDANGRDLLNNAWRLWEQGTPLELLEATQREGYSKNEVMQCIHMGLLCVQEDAAKRPSMATIVLMLNSYSFTLPTPSVPGFHDVSITELRPR